MNVNLPKSTLLIYLISAQMKYNFPRGRCGRDCMELDVQLPMQSVPITTKVVSSNPSRARCTRYNIM